MNTNQSFKSLLASAKDSESKLENLVIERLTSYTDNLDDYTLYVTADANTRYFMLDSKNVLRYYIDFKTNTDYLTENWYSLDRDEMTLQFDVVYEVYDYRANEYLYLEGEEL